jgi:FkbM family methyltransferase
LIYYQDIQHNFCNNVRYLANKELEEKIILYNVNLNDTNFDMFIYDNFDYYSWKIKLNQSYEGEATLHMLNAIKYFEDKYDFENDDIAIIDIGSNVGWFSTYFGTFKYNVLSFEPLPENYYILKKNFCRNNKDFFGNLSTVTIINEVLYPSETYCDYYKDKKNSKKNLVLCDKSKEKNLDKDYIKIDQVKTTKLINFLPLITNKRVILVRLDLEYEGEMAILSGKELIYKYHIPYIFIEFNMLMFALHETRPQDFLRFFTENGYKISLKGFLTEEFISVEDIMRTNFITINLYLVFVGK